jgi:plastocyanin
MKKTLLILVPVLVVGLAAWLLTNRPAQPAATPTPATADNSPTSSTSDCPRVSEKAVTITYSGAFSPACVTVPVGTTITWDNQSGNELEVGANPHPIHSGDRAISNGEFTLNVPAHSTKSETIDKAGTFGYHNHLNPSATGKLIAE